MKCSKILLTVILSATLFFGAHAAYLTNVPQRLVQPDGSILNCLATGDEFHSWLHDSKNFTIIQDPATGYYVYAAKSGKSLVPTTLIAGKSDPAQSGLMPGINLDPEEVVRLSKEKFKVPELKGATGAATTGTINNLVIFIRFSDQLEFSSGIANYNTAFNTTGAVSLKQFFQSVSKSQLLINSTMFPDNGGGGTVVSYQDANPRSYYSVYNMMTNPGGYNGDTEKRVREMTLLKNASEACKAQIEAAGLDLDNDHNGNIDNVCFIIQGAVQAWNDLLWPHRWSLYEYNVRIAGLRVYDYNFILSNSFGVSVLCHEMSHSIGFPDLYRYTTSSTTITPVGRWDVMGSNTTPPQHHSSYTKVKYGRWFPALPEITTDGTYTLSPLSTDAFAGYKIKSPNSTSEYFVVEYRKAEGLFESGLPGSGLIIYRVTPTIRGNSAGPPDEVYVFRTNGTPTETGDINNARYSAESGKTVFNATSNPACLLSNGESGYIEITNVTSAGPTISFNVKILPLPPILTVVPAIRYLPLAGGATTFTINNTGEGTMLWTAEVDSAASWLHITSGASGTNSGTINISGDVNPDNAIRTGFITLNAEGAIGSPKRVTVFQAANPPVLMVAPTSRIVGNIAGTIQFDVSNPGGGTMLWTASVTTGPSWLHITSGSTGSNQGAIELSVDSNESNTGRTGIITVTSDGASGSPMTLTVQQTANPPILLVLPTSLQFDFPGGSAGFEIINTGRGTMPWTVDVTAGSDWIHLLSGESGTDYGTIDISVDKNPTDSIRVGLITVNANGAVGSPMTVSVEQSANTTLGSGLIVNEEMILSVYPNPAMDDLTIFLDRSGSSEGRLVITDMLGRVMFSANSRGISPFKTHIDVSHWTRGCYQVSMDTGTQYLRKLVILQ